MKIIIEKFIIIMMIIIKKKKKKKRKINKIVKVKNYCFLSRVLSLKMKIKQFLMNLIKILMKEQIVDFAFKIEKK